MKIHLWDIENNYVQLQTSKLFYVMDIPSLVEAT